MVMGGQKHAEYVQVLRHPSKQQSTNVTVWGGGDEREGRFGEIEPQKRVKVELIEWRSVDLTQSIPNQPSAHPRLTNTWEPILHAFWE
jgi:hypothetical protein